MLSNTYVGVEMKLVLVVLNCAGKGENEDDKMCNIWRKDWMVSS